MDACKECLGSEQNKEPVCGSDNRTYINACLLKCASCQNPAQNIQEQCKGQCPCKNCNNVCPDIWNPVCGSNGQTYSNPCNLDVTACLNPGLNITLQCQGECPCNIPPTPKPPCQEKCSKCKVGIPNPLPGKEVCGSDGVTYPDSCSLLCASCYNPALVEQCKGKCPCINDPCFKYCYDEFDPVCGTNDETYPSICILEQISCLNPSMNIERQCSDRCPCHSI